MGGLISLSIADGGSRFVAYGRFANLQTVDQEDVFHVKR